MKRWQLLAIVLSSIVLLFQETEASWFIDRAAFHASAHGGLSCLDCHEDVENQDLHPDPRDVTKSLADFFAVEQCLTCHDDISESLKESRHGSQRLKDPGVYQNCLQCHDPHTELPGEGRSIQPDSVPDPYKQSGLHHEPREDLPSLSEPDQACMTCHGLSQTAGEKNAVCFHCHAMQGIPAQVLTSKHVLLIDLSDYPSSPHSEMACLACHTGACRFGHDKQTRKDCRTCHLRHDEKVAHDAHTSVSCEACHLQGITPRRDPESGLITIKTGSPPGEALRVHAMDWPEGGEDRCLRCHHHGNSLGASSKVLPPKGWTCMPCHAATFSLSDPSSMIGVLLFFGGMLLVVSLWLTGNLPGRPSASVLVKLMGTVKGALRVLFSKHIVSIVKALFFDVVLQRRLYRYSKGRWVIHGLIFFPLLFRFFWGAIALLGSLLRPQWSFLWVMLDKNHPLTAAFFDISGILLLIGIAMASARGIRSRSTRVQAVSSHDWLALGLIGAIVVVGFILEGIRIGMTGSPTASAYAPVGFWISRYFTNPSVLTDIYGYIWHIHAVLTAAFIAYLPFSRLLHVIVAPLVLAVNLLLGSLKPKGELKSINADIARKFAVPSIENLTCKERLESFACTECGMCQMACPAHLSGKLLNPKEVVQRVRNQLLERIPSLVSSNSRDSRQLFGESGESIAEEAVWDCTTCGACQQQCPVGIEHVSLFIDLRRQLVERGNIGSNTRIFLENTLSLGNPWGESQYRRLDFARALRLPLLEEERNPDFVYWIGCSSIYDERSRMIPKALSGLLREAGITIAVLGAEEKCCGDPCRRIGEDGLFQSRAAANIETLQKYKVRRVLVHCAHCFNSLKHEYGQFGADFEVIHHSELILDLINQGKIRPKRSINQELTIHDPCYLGRYNDLHLVLRQIVSSNQGINLIEMKKSQEESFCCGAGGGHLWMPGGRGERMENMRIEQAREVGAEVVVTACPYCVVTLDSAAGTIGSGRIKVKDVAELMVESIGITLQ